LVKNKFFPIELKEEPVILLKDKLVNPPAKKQKQYYSLINQINTNYKIGKTMKQLIYILVFLSVAIISSAQTSIGDSSRSEGELDEAILAYKKVFLQNPQEHNNIYNLACSFALTYQQNDSAFYYLNIALKSDSSLWALADPDLIGMADDERWNGIVEQQMEKYQAKNGALANPVYAENFSDL